MKYSIVISSGVIALIGIIFKFYINKIIKKIDCYFEENKKTIAANNEGTKVLLLMFLTNYYEFAKTNGYTDISHKRKAYEVYMAYHNMGGNGLGTKMYEYIAHCPIEKEKKGE